MASLVAGHKTTTPYLDPAMPKIARTSGRLRPAATRASAPLVAFTGFARRETFSRLRKFPNRLSNHCVGVASDGLGPGQGVVTAPHPTLMPCRVLTQGRDFHAYNISLIAPGNARCAPSCTRCLGCRFGEDFGRQPQRATPSSRTGRATTRRARAGLGSALVGRALMGRPWTDAEIEALKALWNIHGGGFRKIGAAMGRSRGSIDGKSRVLGLQFHGGRARVLADNDPAMLESRSVFPSRVIQPDGNVLKSGDNQRKLGRVVMKGPWKGFPIYSLSLEERATCPPDCKLLAGCYANNMGHAKRYQDGPLLERQLAVEVAFHQRRNPRGFVIRLHLIGDFPSVENVEFWREMIAQHSALHIFGYSAWQPDTVIGAAIADLRSRQWDRFAVRTSGAGSGPRTMVVPDTASVPAGAVLCPAQHNPGGKTLSCSSCGICWSPAARERPVAFLSH